MYIGMTASICSLIYTCLILIIYFKKSKLKNDENAIYSFMIFSNALGLLLEFFVYLFALLPNVESSFIPMLIERLYFIYLFTWIYLFAIYIFITSFEEQKSKYNIVSNRLFLSISVGIYIILMTMILILPVEHIINGTSTYSTGPSCFVMYISAVISVIVSMIFVIINRKKMEPKKKIPMISLIFCIVLLLVIRFVIPEALFVSTAFSFVTILTYFTIENPDIKAMKELAFSKEIAIKSKNETMDILNDMSENLEDSLDKLVSIGYKKIDKSNLDEVNKEIKYIQKFSIDLADRISGTLDIAKIEGSYVSRNEKYDTYDMLNDIRYFFNYKKGNKEVIVTTDIKNDINKVLYGDSEKIKQVVLYTLGYIIDIIKTGTINVCVDNMNVGRFCRLKFHFYVDNPIIKEYVNYNKYNETYELSKNGINQEVIVKLIKLLDGKMVTKVSESNITEILLTIDQRVIPEYDVEKVVIEDDKKIKYFNANDKRVLIIDDNKFKIKEIIRLLKPYKVNIDFAMNKDELNKKIDSNKVFNLILIDDIIPESLVEDEYDYSVSVCDYTKRLLKRTRYKVPLVILVTPNEKKYEDKYINSGFDNYIIKPVTKLQINNILNKYFQKNNDN